LKSLFYKETVAKQPKFGPFLPTKSAFTSYGLSHPAKAGCRLRAKNAVESAVAPTTIATAVAAVATATAAATITTVTTAAITATTAATVTAATAVRAAEVAVIATAAAVRTTTAAAATAVAATTTAVTATAFAWRTLLSWASFVDHHGAATQILTMHTGNGCLCLRVVAHFHKAKAFGATGIALHHHASAFDFTKRTKCVLQIFITHRVRQIAYVQSITHLVLPINV
jgi:hypothetical protein